MWQACAWRHPDMPTLDLELQDEGEKEARARWLTLGEWEVEINIWFVVVSRTSEAPDKGPAHW